MSFAFIARLAMRDWRAGELKLLLAAVVVAVGTVSAISLFVDRLQQALLSESANFLAADRVISGTQAIPESFVVAASEGGFRTARTMSFASMLFVGDDLNQLVSVKAVTAGYPLRGSLKIADAPFAADRLTSEIPVRGEVWLDSRLFPILGIDLGAEVSLGLANFKVTRVVTEEPDKSGGFLDLGPRLLMNFDDVAATEIIQPGSRIYYRLLLAGAEESFPALRESLPLEPDFRWQSIRESSPSIGQALERAESFLLLGGLLAVLLASVAVALAAQRYASRHFDHVAVMKTIGATPASIQSSFVGVLAIVGCVAVIIGLILGYLVQFGIVYLLGQVIPMTLPAPGVSPLWLGGITGLVCLGAFALPPLLQLKNISPMRVIRRDFEGGRSQLLSYLLAGIGSLGLLIWYTKDLMLTLWTLLGTLSVLVVFGSVAILLLRGSRVAGMQAGSAWRLAMAGLQRRYRENVAQILIFGMSIMLLLILLLLRTSLLAEWQAQLPSKTPNHFMLNITADQVVEVKTEIGRYSDVQGAVFPMIRGSVVTVNGVDVEQWELSHGDLEQGGPPLSSERNITWSAGVPADNDLIEGEWWLENSTEWLISVEEGYAQRGGLSIGDELEFSVGGLPITVTVASIRRLDWDSFKPNFFVVFSPIALEQFPATFMTSFYLEKKDKRALNQLLAKFPTITVIEVDALIAQIQSIITRVTRAVELVFGLVLIAGCMVLIASVQASRDARFREHALLRTLGATRKLIRGSLAAEFLVLGLFAGVVAVMGAEITTAMLQTQVFNLKMDLHPWLWVAGPIIGALVISLVGLTGTRKLVDAPPIAVLRALE